MELKQNQVFFHKKYSDMTSLFFGCKIQNYFSNFCVWHLLISLQKWAKTSKMKRKKWDMCKFDCIFPYSQSIMPFQWLLKFISWEDLSKKWMIAVLEEQFPSFTFIP